MVDTTAGTSLQLAPMNISSGHNKTVVKWLPQTSIPTVTNKKLAGTTMYELNINHWFTAHYTSQYVKPLVYHSLWGIE